MRLTIASLFTISLAVPAFAQTEPPADFDAGDTNGDGFISPEENKAALFEARGRTTSE